MAKELASGFQEAETSSLVISAHTLLLWRLDAAAPSPNPQHQKIQEKKVLQNDIPDGFQQGNCSEQVQFIILGTVQAFSGRQIGLV